MKRFIRAVLVFVVGSIVVNAGAKAVENLENGYDIFGKPREDRQQFDSFGNIKLKETDYQVV